MQASSAFFGGAILGGVIAAACGFDLFPGERTERSDLARRGEELERTRSSLGRVKDDLRRSEERIRQLQGKIVSLEGEAGRQAAGSGALDARARDLQAKLLEARSHMDRLSLELGRSGAELSSTQQALKSCEARLGRAREEALAQLLEFFSRERDPADASIASDFLASPATLEEKQRLVLELAKWNKDVLLALPHRPAPGGATPEEAGIVTTSASQAGAEAAPSGAGPPAAQGRSP